MKLLNTGQPYKVIAEELGISSATVQRHIANIFLKLEVNNKVEAINKLQQKLP